VFGLLWQFSIIAEYDAEPEQHYFSRTVPAPYLKRNRTSKIGLCKTVLKIFPSFTVIQMF
jgi:hypothetical protein